MWVVNADRDVLINLATGLRIAIMPINKQKDSEAQLYGVVVQAPADATLPLGRPLPTGFSNTVLIHGVPLDDCENLLEMLSTKLDAWQVPQAPILLDEPQMAVLTYTNHQKVEFTFICEDEITAERMLYLNVADHWPADLGEIPEDEEQAIDIYYQDFAKDEARRIKPAPYVRWKDLRGKRR